MAEAATHLVSNVLPYAPYRQFVLSFPIAMRYWLQSNRKLYAKIHAIAIKYIHRYYKTKALGQGLKDPTPGTISFTQRWGSALNLNPHMHVLAVDGVYTTTSNGATRFNHVDDMSDKDVAELVSAISKAVVRFFVKQGYLTSEGELVENPTADPLFAESESLSLATQSSITSKIAFGPNAGNYVTKIGSGFGYGEEIPLAKGKLCYSVNGFSLHCATAVKTQQRDRLYKLIEYIARGPLSNERLEITSNGKVKLTLKTRWSDGTTHLLFTPGEFIEKLAALIPPPKAHLVRWAGVFAPNSPYRKQITLKPELKKGFQFKKANEDKEAAPPLKNSSWSKMLAQVFKIDVSRCDHCGGDMAAISAITERDGIVRYLKHINIDFNPPPRAPPKHRQESFDFDQSAPISESDLMFTID